MESQGEMDRHVALITHYTDVMARGSTAKLLINNLHALESESQLDILQVLSVDQTRPACVVLSVSLYGTYISRPQ